MITVELVSEDAAHLLFDVQVVEGATRTRHVVTAARGDVARLAREGEGPDALVRRAFEFLLAREPKEAILRRFDLMVIGRYFPEFEREITRRA